MSWSCLDIFRNVVLFRFFGPTGRDCPHFVPMLTFAGPVGLGPLAAIAAAAITASTRPTVPPTRAILLDDRRGNIAFFRIPAPFLESHFDRTLTYWQTRDRIHGDRADEIAEPPLTPVDGD